MESNLQENVKRKFICVQIAEELDITRAGTKEEKKVISNAIKFCQSLNLPTNIAEIAKERIRRAGQHISDGLTDGQVVDTGFKVFKLAQSNFKQWQKPLSGSLNAEQQLDLLADFQDIVAPDATVADMAYELALRLGFELTVPMVFSDGIVWLDDHKSRKTALLLEHINTDILAAVLVAKPAKVFALDKVFAGDDALKANTALQLKDAGVAFETL